MSITRTDNHNVLSISQMSTIRVASSNIRGLANSFGAGAKRRKARMVSHEKPTFSRPASSSSGQTDARSCSLALALYE